MPSKANAMPALLGAHVHALLVQAGMDKTAKKFESEFDGELPEIEGMMLMELYEKHLAPPPKKEKKSKKAKEEPVEEEQEEEAPKRKKRGEVEEEEPKKKAKKSKKKAESESEEEEEVEKSKTKKSAKTKEEEEPAAAEEPVEEEEKQKKGVKGKNTGGNTPFQRIKSDEVTYLKVRGGQDEADRLLDNTFESKFKGEWAKGEVREDYGAKASAILAAVRGKDFRHEKTKKKRGTYKGGPIDLASNSIKFVNSDDED